MEQLDKEFTACSIAELDTESFRPRPDGWCPRAVADLKCITLCGKVLKTMHTKEPITHKLRVECVDLLRSSAKVGNRIRVVFKRVVGHAQHGKRVWDKIIEIAGEYKEQVEQSTPEKLEWVGVLTQELRAKVAEGVWDETSNHMVEAINAHGEALSSAMERSRARTPARHRLSIWRASLPRRCWTPFCR